MTGASAASNSLENSTISHLTPINTPSGPPNINVCVKIRRFTLWMNNRFCLRKLLFFKPLTVAPSAGLGARGVGGAANFCNLYVARV